MSQFLNELTSYPAERSGRGVPKNVGAYGRESIRIEKNFIIVTIPFNRINVTPFELNMGEKSEIAQNEPVNEPLKRVLAVIKERPNLSKEKIAEKIGMSRATVTRALAKLVESGAIKRVGSDKTGHWEILSESQE